MPEIGVGVPASNHNEGNALGLSTWTFENDDVVSALKRMRALGFLTVEIWADRVHLDPRRAPNVDLVADTVAELGLTVHSIHAPFSDFDPPFPTPGRTTEVLDVIEMSFDYARRLGAGIVVVHPMSHLNGIVPDVSDIADAVTSFVSELQERARRHSIRMALENLPHFHFPPLVCSLASLSSRFGSNEIGFCLDIGHALLNGYSIESEITSAGSRLASTHISNNDGAEDRHWIPTRGLLDWPGTYASFHEHGYHGPFMLEIRGGEVPDVVLAEQRRAPPDRK